jgi:outer membrane protein OmpA-like peptidoglycan-associated protein
MRGAPPRLVLLAAIGAVALSACASRPTQPAPQTPAPAAPPGTLVVLLPAEEGEATGRVTVSNAQGKAELMEPFSAVRLNETATPPAPTSMDESDVRRTFGEVLDDLPDAAERFNLYFRTDSSELTQASQALLPVVLKAVAARAVPDVTVIGHTDTTGGAASNFRLGLKRAVTVRALLISIGVQPSLVEIESHGEADLLVRTPDGTDEPRNRRVEITVK